MVIELCIFEVPIEFVDCKCKFVSFRFWRENSLLQNLNWKKFVKAQCRNFRGRYKSKFETKYFLATFYCKFGKISFEDHINLSLRLNLNHHGYQWKSPSSYGEWRNNHGSWNENERISLDGQETKMVHLRYGNTICVVFMGGIQN